VLGFVGEFAKKRVISVKSLAWNRGRRGEFYLFEALWSGGRNQPEIM
jgi:hypothetical protein